MPQPSDHAHMRALFQYGFQRARHGYACSKKPPH
jgi:hypothetical protein